MNTRRFSVIQGMLMLESLQCALRGSVRLNASGKKPRLRKMRSLLLACGALCYSALAPALGLGDITLHSALNQPLDAEIALVEPGDLAEGELSVSLATAEEFSRAGVERVFFLNDLRFTAILRGNRSVIRVVSNKPVNEPFLNFLVQVNQPNGRLLREYTVLIDPAGSPGIVSFNEPEQDSATSRQPSAAARQQAAPPGPPPPALQGKRYTVVKGDNPWIIARRLHDAGSKASTNELMQGIRALNPGSERLAVGQSLLLPDTAVPATSIETAADAQPASVVPAQSESTSEQLAASVLENQHLQKTVDDQQARLQAQDEQIAASQKKINDLETRLAEVERLPASPAVPDAPALTSPPPVASQAKDSGGPNLLVVAGLVVLLLLLMLAFWVRRQRDQAQATPEPLPAQPAARDSRVSPVTPHTPENAGDEANYEATAQKTAAPRREPVEVSDVLEGVNLYVAYGRLGEAVGILREALLKEAERLDLGMRLLEVLGQQGDAVGYAEQESRLLESGVSAQALQDTRARFAKLSAVPAQVPSTPPVLAEIKAPVPASSAQDEFQLNLDDLSLESDWDLISPFDTTPPVRNSPVTDAPPGFDPTFTSNLKELPEVFEISDEQFLSDFSEPESALPSTSEIEALDEAFLDSFASTPQELEIEPLSVDFDTQEREQSCAGKLEQAQTCIDDGDLDSAIRLLTELLEEGGEPLQQTARNLLASIR